MNYLIKISINIRIYLIISETLLIVIISFSKTYGQELDSAASITKVNFSGNINLNQIIYASNRHLVGRDPYSFVLSGNLNISYLGLDLPLSFSYSNQHFTYYQPFNQFGLTPTYKNIKAYIGYNSMNFSKYTLSNHVFLGGGVAYQINPKFTISAMYGRLQKATTSDSLREIGTGGSPLPPLFQRMGYGVKLAYQHEDDQLQFVLFHGKDDPHSLAIDSASVKPQENLVLSIGGSKKISDHLHLSAEIAQSGVTRDLSAWSKGKHAGLAFQLASPLFKTRNDTEFFTALKTSLNFSKELYGLAIGYEKVDPGYVTHGAYFFINDFENITISGNTAIFEGKLNFHAEAGFQKSLNENSFSSNSRFVKSIGLGYTPVNQLNINISYSNFQNYSYIQSQFVDINQLTEYDNFDTLQQFYQVNQSANLNAFYTLQKEDHTHTFSTNLAVNQSNEEQAAQSVFNVFYNSNINYYWMQKKSGWGMNAAFNSTLMEMEEFSSKTLGPLLGISKKLGETLRMNGTISRSETISDNTQTGIIHTFRCTANYQVKKKHRFSMSNVWVHKGTAESSFSEFTSMLGYHYNF